MRWRDRVFTRWDRPGRRWALALLGSLVISARGRAWSRIRYRDGFWEHRHPEGWLVHPRISLWTLPALRQLTQDHFGSVYTLRPGDVIVDIGADSGSDMLAFARAVGPTGHVVAVEAHPRLAQCLERTRQLNALAHVTAVHAAIVGIDGPVTLSDTEHYQANRVTATGSLIVPGVTLDTLVARLDLARIDLLKVNIEGGEAPALAGMAQTLARTRHVAIACHDFLADWGRGETLRTRQAVEAALDAQGFTLHPRSDPRPWIRDCVYGTARCEAPGP